MLRCNDLAVGSADAVVLSGELSELLGRPVSPVEFWQYPTINALARFLTGSEPESAVEALADPIGHSVDEPIAVVGLGCRFPGEITGPDALWQFLCDGRWRWGRFRRIGGRGLTTAHRRWPPRCRAPPGGARF